MEQFLEKTALMLDQKPSKPMKELMGALGYLDIIDHKLIKKAGYNKLHSDKYRNLGIKIVEQNCYEVDENFPRLISSFLSTNLSERVSKISYTINLDGINTIPLNDTFK